MLDWPRTAGPGSTGAAAGADLAAEADLVAGTDLLAGSGSAAPESAAEAGLTALSDLTALTDLFAAGSVLVLSGAGLSTESGIPDYRGASGSLRKHIPMTFQEFVGSEEARRRYWSRSHLGWRTVARARPNTGHRAVAALQAGGRIGGVITQNVDGLHQAAGSADPVELHGSLARVVCLGCGSRYSRADLDMRLHAANPDFAAAADRTRSGAPSRINPDGDVELDRALAAGFRTVPCAACADGILKPDVVFFGENVPKDRVQQCFAMVDAAEALLVLGSSLTVLSGLRFVRYAAKAGKPVAIVNQGATRGDELAALRVDRPLGPTLVGLAARLGCPVAPVDRAGADGADRAEDGADRTAENAADRAADQSPVSVRPAG